MATTSRATAGGPPAPSSAVIDAPRPVIDRVPSFNAWLRDTGVVPEGETWVLARRTPGMVERYGASTVFFTQKRYAELEEEHRVMMRDDTIGQIILAQNTLNGGPSLREMMTLAFEAGRSAR